MYGHGAIFASTGTGARFRDVDGHEYVDFNLADMSLFCGFAPEPVAQAVASRAASGGQFLLPTEDAIAVSEALAARYRLPYWQFTLAATSRESRGDAIGQGCDRSRDRRVLRGAIPRP